MVVNSIVIYLNKQMNISSKLYLIIKLKIIFNFEKLEKLINKWCTLKISPSPKTANRFLGFITRTLYKYSSIRKYVIYFCLSLMESKLLR